MKLVPISFKWYKSALNGLTILDTDTERKGKLVEKRGRKAIGLKLKSYDSLVAENLYNLFHTK